MTLVDAWLTAMQLMKEHGLTGWTFKFDHAKNRCGQCHYSKKQISLSEHYVKLNEVASVTNTILHEIAHALVGHGYGHGPTWKRKAKEIGCTASRCAANIVTVPGKFEAVCQFCGRKHYAHRRTRSIKVCLCLPKHKRTTANALTFKERK